MGYVRTNVANYVKDHNGLKYARSRAEQWYENSLSSLKETGVTNYTGPFLAGKIYVFRYQNPATEEKLKWWDYNPVVLSLGRKNNLDIGVNLNLLPYTVKLFLLDEIYEKLRPAFEREMAKNPNNAQKQKHIQALMYDNLKRFVDHLGFGFAIRTYHSALRLKTGVVSYENWHKIALMDIFESEDATKVQVLMEYFKYIKKHKLR